MEDFNLEEANVQHLWNKWNNYDVCMISARRHEFPLKQNRARNTQLGQDLANSPFEYIRTMGGYPEELKGKDDVEHSASERSYFVVNKDPNKTQDFENFMFDLCKKYNQDSIFLKTSNYPSKLYDKDRNVVDYTEKNADLDKMDLKSDSPYYSKIGGTKFSFVPKESCKKSEFRKLVEEVLKENGFTLD